MFGKKYEEEEMMPVVKTSKETVISEGTKVKGNFVTSDPITIEGTLVGEIETTADVVVTATGSYQGNAKMRSLKVAGKADGNLKCKEMTQILGSGVVSGSLETVRLLTDDGSTFDGQLVMVQAQKLYED